MNFEKVDHWCPTLGLLCPSYAMSVSQIGCSGQALIPYFSQILVAYPGHASLRSLFDTRLVALHVRVGFPFAAVE